jgi:hypothetical protein
MTWQRNASTSGSSNPLVPPTQSASVERSSFTPSRPPYRSKRSMMLPIQVENESWRTDH